MHSRHDPRVAKSILAAAVRADFLILLEKVQSTPDEFASEHLAAIRMTALALLESGVLRSSDLDALGWDAGGNQITGNETSKPDAA